MFYQGDSVQATVINSLNRYRGRMARSGGCTSLRVAGSCGKTGTTKYLKEEVWIRVVQLIMREKKQCCGFDTADHISCFQVVL